jgi:hypothetical protein
MTIALPVTIWGSKKWGKDAIIFIAIKREYLLVA